jgi:hypothetical protein
MTIHSEQTPTPLQQDALRRLSRRTVLRFAGAAGAAAPFGVFGAAVLPEGAGAFPLCRTAAAGGALRPLKLAWNVASR